MAAPGNWLAQAGVLMGSYPDLGHTWWGDLTLTLGLPEINITLDGRATFLRPAAFASAAIASGVMSGVPTICSFARLERTEISLSSDSARDELVAA